MTHLYQQWRPKKTPTPKTIHPVHCDQSKIVGGGQYVYIIYMCRFDILYDNAELIQYFSCGHFKIQSCESQLMGDTIV